LVFKDFSAMLLIDQGGLPGLKIFQVPFWDGM
jgi:hypothetical protein